MIPDLYWFSPALEDWFHPERDYTKHLWIQYILSQFHAGTASARSEREHAKPEKGRAKEKARPKRAVMGGTNQFLYCTNVLKSSPARWDAELCLLLFQGVSEATMAIAAVKGKLMAVIGDEVRDVTVRRFVFWPASDVKYQPLLSHILIY